MPQWRWGCIYLSKLVFSFSSDKYLGVELLDYMVVLLQMSYEEPPYFSHSSSTYLYFRQQCTGTQVSPPVPVIFPLLFALVLFLIAAILMDVSWSSLVVLISISLMNRDFWAYFHVIIGHLCLLWRNVYSSSLSFLNFCCCCWIVGVLYIFWISTSYLIYDLHGFSPIWLVVSLCNWLFPLMSKSFKVQCGPFV